MKLPVPVHLKGLAAWIPETKHSAADAIAAGALDEETAQELGYTALPTADLAPPEMAVLAARSCLESAGVGAGEVGILLHAWMHYQGHDLWSPPHYIANELDMPEALPVGVQQVCNGGAVGIEFAIARLLAEQGDGYALVTTADRFGAPGFDRWRSDYGIGYGDGATALLLRRLRDGDTGLVLRAINTRAAVELERMHRGDDSFTTAARSHSPQVDMRRTKKAFLQENGIESFAKTSRARLTEVIEASLADAGIDGTDPKLRYAVLPRLGRKTLDLAYLPAISELTSAEILDLGRATGHLGAGDTAANLVQLSEEDRLQPGEHALIINAGAGFTWSCLLVTKL